MEDAVAWLGVHRLGLLTARQSLDTSRYQTQAPASELSSFSTIGALMQTPAADAWSAGRLDAALARPSTMSRRQLLVALTLPAKSRFKFCANVSCFAVQYTLHQSRFDRAGQCVLI